jgi:hypothetical protein
VICGTRGLVSAEAQRREAEIATTSTPGAPWRTALRRRELASTTRAARFARNQVWERHLSFIRRTWWFLALIAIGMPLALAPLALLEHGGLRWAIWGVSAATGFWLTVMFVVLGAGAVGSLMGVSAEESTIEQLRTLPNARWRIVNGLRLSTGDIDHVAVGPPGVLVVETKWSADPWPIGLTNGDAFMQQRLAAAVEQVRRNAGQVRAHHYFRRRIGVAPVRALLVVWSASLPVEGSPEWDTVGDVDVVRGRSLGTWLKTLDGDSLGAEGVEEVWSELAVRAAVVDRYDDERLGARRPTLVRMLSRWIIEAPLGLLLAAYAFAGLVGLGLPWWALITAEVVGLVLGLRARRWRVLRWGALGWCVGLALMLGAFPVLVVVQLLR